MDKYKINKNLILFLVLLYPLVIKAHDDHSELNGLKQSFSNSSSLFKKIKNAFSTISFEGKFSYFKNTKMNSEDFFILSDSSEANKNNLIMSLKNKEKKIIDSDQNKFLMLNIFSGDVSDKKHHYNDQSIVFDKIAYIQKNYQLNFLKKDRIATHDAQCFSLMPLNKSLYHYQLCLDSQYFLLLSLVTFNKRGDVVERLQYKQLEIINKLSEKQVKLLGDAINKKEKTLPLNISRLVKNNTISWKLAPIPSGFNIAKKSYFKIDETKEESQLVIAMYSDGMADFFIFIQESSVDSKMNYENKNGLMSTVSKLVSNNKKYYNVTVLGAIPLAVAKNIVDSIEFIH